MARSSMPASCATAKASTWRAQPELTSARCSRCSRRPRPSKRPRTSPIRRGTGRKARPHHRGRSLSPRVTRGSSGPERRGRQGGVAVAAATRVIEASPHRVAAPCPYFGACGGCQLQHASYGHQLELKRQVVEEAWARAGLRLPPDTPVLGMDDPWRYRVRGEFEAVAGAGGWRVGFHRQRSHSVLPIDSCVIHDARIERALPAFARAANELQLNGLQNLLLTAEPTGNGLLWRIAFHRPGPAWASA